MELSLDQAAKQYRASRYGLYHAVKGGRLKAHMIYVTQLRVHSQDVEAYLKTIGPHRRWAGRKGGTTTAANRRARQRGEPVTLASRRGRRLAAAREQPGVVLSALSAKTLGLTSTSARPRTHAWIGGLPAEAR